MVTVTWGKSQGRDWISSTDTKVRTANHLTLSWSRSKHFQSFLYLLSQAMQESLMFTLKELLNHQWTHETEEAWNKLFRFILSTMLKGLQSTWKEKTYALLVFAEEPSFFTPHNPAKIAFPVYHLTTTATSVTTATFLADKPHFDLSTMVSSVPKVAVLQSFTCIRFIFRMK